MTQYIGALYTGFLSTLPRHIVQDFLYEKVVCRAVPANTDGTTDYPILSLRAVEAILCQDGYTQADVKIAHPYHIEHVVEADTQIVGVSAKDPLGIGPATTSWIAMFGGQPQNRIRFAALMQRIRRLKEQYNFKVIFGGPGAWQVQKPKTMDYYGIDYVLMGEGERVIPNLFAELETDSYSGPRVIEGPLVEVDEIPNILGPTNSSLIEVSRGCGRGCKFCVTTVSGRLRSFPKEKILQDAQMYLDRGIKSVTFQSEDVLRYGSTKLECDEDAVLDLYKEVFALGAKHVVLTHASLITFAYQPELITKLTKLLRKHGMPGYGCQPGLETGSGRLIEMHMKNKCYPRDPYEWPDVVREAFDVMERHRWAPCCTLMMGLPGEEKEDVQQTIELIKDLKHHFAFFVPLSFLPVTTTSLAGTERCARDTLTVSNWELLEVTWKHNLKIMNTGFRYVAQGRFPFIRMGLEFATRGFGAFLMTLLRKRKKEASKAGRF
jgi:radical SAM superfamily enzyme YgiQ (UPF0313 family)